MALKNKYQREKQQYSNDSGHTWIDVSPANYRRGRLIEAGSEDCNTIEWKEVTGSWFCIGFNETQYRWVTVSDEYVCVGYDKYEKLKKQESIDGVNWTDVVPLETMQGNLIEANSTDCGYVPPTPVDYENQYLTIESLEDSNKIEFGGADGLQKTIQVSKDGGTTWISKTSPNKWKTITLATLNTGDKLLIKGTNTAYSDVNQNNTIIGRKKFIIYGNIMSLISGDNFVDNKTLTANYTFCSLFGSTYNYETLISAENLVLPATTLTDRCYGFMFQDCESLVNAPTLPATTLADGCYYKMFEGCTSLETAPELPATTLASDCYNGMFYECTKLTTAPALPVTTLASNCYQYMFYGCLRLVNAPTLPATTLANNCYEYMFYGCTNLTTAPVLPATTLSEYCYSAMFYKCTKLNYIKCLATDISATGCTDSWVYKVANTGTFVKAASMTSWTTGDNGIPTGWTVVTE